jgi:hypothetical protein
MAYQNPKDDFYLHQKIYLIIYNNHTISILYLLKTLIILVKNKASLNVYRYSEKNLYFNYKDNFLKCP